MSGVLERLSRLVALSQGSEPGSAEARNAAMKACKLIVEHRIVLSVPDDHDAPKGERVRHRDKSLGEEIGEGIGRVFRDAAKQVTIDDVLRAMKRK